VIAVAVATLVASLIGSLHCVVMCGPLLAIAHRGGTVQRSLILSLWHAGGRLLTYVALGAAAGAVGKAVNVAGHLGNVQRMAAILSSLLLISWGISMVWPWRSIAKKSSSGGGMFAQRLVRLRRRSPRVQASIMGVLTGLLPCGWLWAFVASAAGQGSILGGAALMFAFWLGTVPAMVGVLTIGGGLLTKIRSKYSWLVATALVVMGLLTLWHRWHDAGGNGVTAPSCHHRSTTGAI
jgi:uncharacterized protein